ncbi:MAG: ATP synthase subunit I [Azoarcus sp.]|jgi:ATP synthase protein I|nr:ATP synthase subunit I [Azoarcus sp.]
MHKALLLQLGATLLAMAAAAVFWGSQGSVSALCGAATYVLPSSLFAWRLRWTLRRNGQASVAAFVAGELVKLASTVGLLVLAAVLYREVHWGAFLMGLVLALKANLFAFLVKT